jgi:hypothetical protein
MRFNNSAAQPAERQIAASVASSRWVHRCGPILLFSMCRWLTVIALVLSFPFVPGHNTLHAQSREEGAPHPKSGRCGSGTVPLTFRDGLALARISINQKPVTFIVDSAGMTMINSDHVLLPVFQRIRTGAVTFSASDAPELWDVVSVKSFVVGSEDLHDSKILAHSLRILEGKLGGEIDGILGKDVLKLWESVTLDYKRRTLILEGGSTCRAAEMSESLLMLQHDATPQQRRAQRSP